MSQHVKLCANYRGRVFKLKMGRETTVMQALIKIRKYLQIKPCEALFLFFRTGLLGQGVLYPNSKTLGEISAGSSTVIDLDVVEENTFGSLDRRFLNAEIKELGGSGAWCLKINYSFYNLYEFTDVFVFKSQLEAERKLLVERCHGYLKIKNKNDDPINIEPVE